MRILIGGSTSKIFHLKEFQDKLIEVGVETKLVIDTEIYEGFPSRKLKKWFQTKKEFNKLINEFKPNLILVDRQHALFDTAAVESNIPVAVMLRGDYWSEIEWAKQTLYKGPIEKIVINNFFYNIFFLYQFSRTINAQVCKTVSPELPLNKLCSI